MITEHRIENERVYFKLDGDDGRYIRSICYRTLEVHPIEYLRHHVSPDLPIELMVGAYLTTGQIRLPVNDGFYIIDENIRHVKSTELFA